MIRWFPLFRETGRMLKPRHFVWLTVGLAAACPTMGRAVRADGWHNAALATASLDDWLRDVRAVVPDLDDKLRNSTLRAGQGIEDLKRAREKAGDAPAGEKPIAGGRLKANLTPREKAVLARKANDCLEVLAYMKRENIYPQEFPNFPLDRMAEYRGTAKQLLSLMGSPGASAVVNQCRAHLMGAGPHASDITFHPEYFDELLTLLGEAVAAGQVSTDELQSLSDAAQGNKPPAVNAFATKVQNTVIQNLSFSELAQWATSTTSTRQKALLMSGIKRRLSEAEPSELADFLSVKDLDARTKDVVIVHLRRLLPELDISSLMKLTEASVDADLTAAATQAFAQRSPTYAEVKDDLQAIWALRGSANSTVAQYSRWHIANAFVRAPLGECLRWLAEDDAALHDEIWKQLDVRMARADEARRRGYGAAAVQVIQDEDQSPGMRLAALQLAGRLKDRQLATPIVDGLTTLPRELWPAAGATLRQLTNQDFGPRPGDGAAEVSVAVKMWRAWLEQNGK